jgi:hypothetical protein
MKANDVRLKQKNLSQAEKVQQELPTSSLAVRNGDQALSGATNSIAVAQREVVHGITELAAKRRMLSDAEATLGRVEKLGTVSVVLGFISVLAGLLFLNRSRSPESNTERGLPHQGIHTSLG